MIFYEEIFREFNRNKVKYVIVGGIAVNLLGLLRSTADLDILIEMSSANIKKVVNILKKKGYRPKHPVDPMGMADLKIREDWTKEKNMKVFNYFKHDALKEVDIIIDSPVSFEHAIKRAVRLKSGNMTLPVISIADLIKMKKTAKRNIDRLDVMQLRKMMRLK